jgi:SAM-dependent methyltransferase
MNKEQAINQFIKSSVVVKDDYLLKACANKNVLDVGCVGQNKFFTDPRWVHAKLKKVSAKLTGVDINQAHEQEFEKLGYALFTPEKLAESEEKFDVIVMGDVIEHVDNLVEFLNFYKAFLNDNGVMVITTPNALSIRQTFNVFLYGRPGINDEHTSVLECNTMLELFGRTKLDVVDFTWLHEYSKAKKLSTKIVYGVSRFMYSIRKYYAPYFVFTVCNQKEK